MAVASLQFLISSATLGRKCWHVVGEFLAVVVVVVPVVAPAAVALADIVDISDRALVSSC